MSTSIYRNIGDLFRQDNLAAFQEYYSDSLPTTILGDAAIFSAHHRIPPATQRALLNLVISYTDACTVVEYADGILNYEHDFPRPDKLVCDWLKAEGGYSITMCQLDPDVAATLNTPASRPQLLQRLGECSEEEFRGIIRHLYHDSELTSWLSLPIMVALYERIQRLLHDDRLYYTILAASATTSIIEPGEPDVTQVILADVNDIASGEVDLSDLIGPDSHAQIVEAARRILAERNAASPSTYNPNSGTEWVAQHPRKRSARRRRG